MTRTPAFICDLDGTLAILNERNPYDASDCESDLVNEPVLAIVESLVVYKGFVPLFVSGRQNKDRQPTKAWLEQNLWPANPNQAYAQNRIGWGLFMRTTGDFRKDAIVKQEIYLDCILPYYDVRLVLDDRNQVVDMWRRNGLTCLQVAEGNF